MVIAHIIARDKFTNDYIVFMQSAYPEIDQVFFTRTGDYPITAADKRKIIEVKEYADLDRKDYLRILHGAGKIIVSGVWMSPKDAWVFISNRLVKKIYFQFWGHDLYHHRNKPANNIERLARFALFYSFKRAAGLIFLIDGEYEKFQSITHISNKSFVAPMPAFYQSADGQNGCGKKENEKYILVGNSATKTNFHQDVFRMIRHLMDDDTKVLCPLSYGEDQCREEVVREGNKILGARFAPLLDYMEADEYARLLSAVDVGIFYNDRQQAMGNINALLLYGKKVYLRTGTSMWDNYTKKGYTVFDADTIEKAGSQEFWRMDDAAREANIRIGARNYSVEAYKKAWDKIILR